MSLKSELEVFASAGDVTAPSSGWYSAGWTYRHRPERQYWNYRSKRNDEALNAHQANIDAVRTLPPQMGVNDFLCGGLVSQWQSPIGAPNTLLTSAIRDTAVGWDLATETPHLLVLHADNSLYRMLGCWSFESSPWLSSALSPAYPTTPDEVYSVCADASYIYLAWGLSGGNIWISCFNASTLAEVWSTDTGYARVAGAEETVKMIHADTDNLAVSLPTGGVTTAARTIGILDKATGATAAYGQGSYASGYGDNFSKQTARLVSDGEHIYWLQSQAAATRTFYLISAKISNPAISDYSSLDLGEFDTGDTYTWPAGVLALQAGSSIAGVAGIVIVSANGVFRFWATGGTYARQMFTLANFDAFGTALTGHDVVLGTDGLNLWAHMIREEPGADEDTLFVKVPLGRFGALAWTSSTPTEQYEGIHILHDSRIADQPYGKFLFDGRDMWMALASGRILRIANPGAR